MKKQTQTQTKEAQVRMTLDPDQFDLISKAAAAKGLNVTAFCRMASLERAKHELAESGG